MYAWLYGQRGTGRSSVYFRSKNRIYFLLMLVERYNVHIAAAAILRTTDA